MTTSSAANAAPYSVALPPPLPVSRIRRYRECQVVGQGVTVMEMNLLGLRHRTEPGNWVFFELVGTEQGLQVRSTEVNARGEVVHGPVPQFSVSYPEILQLSDDIEKGKLAPPYGIVGNGLDTQSEVWQGDRPE